MLIANLSIDYKNPPEGFPDRFALTNKEKKKLYIDLINQKSITGVVILQTCNRFEIYFTNNAINDGIKHVVDVIIKKFGEDISEYILIKPYLDTVK
ncbi:MAG: hypothetical protein ACFFG0_21610, partial [Candidatus Thorarchaeota archaeon]